ncbi:Oidioi.mRNA.OKI2018_I69.PAR.g9721.t1.cds [Oikopleura dioica]|uniref:Oidioi.mRNA.OKI2018_I69.PAR.g9721.t1.cds n=1 Tax=Oikopleura dioica TaxID=34765 RepID=A0ABN7RM13_OIKDI|nr:Oidioi.mRNA.OKI2018_I69.PAR.g9721.t1.cds [Oikopleura dioica]
MIFLGLFIFGASLANVETFELLTFEMEDVYFDPRSVRGPRGVLDDSESSGDNNDSTNSSAVGKSLRENHSFENDQGEDEDGSADGRSFMNFIEIEESSGSSSLEVIGFMLSFNDSEGSGETMERSLIYLTEENGEGEDEDEDVSLIDYYRYYGEEENSGDYSIEITGMSLGLNLSEASGDDLGAIERSLVNLTDVNAGIFSADGSGDNENQTDPVLRFAVDPENNDDIINEITKQIIEEYQKLAGESSSIPAFFSLFLLCIIIF